jgi:DNA polymerase alpha-associated DNA helicase A
MQLPPTILSVDKPNDKKKVPDTNAKTKSTPKNGTSRQKQNATSMKRASDYENSESSTSDSGESEVNCNSNAPDRIKSRKQAVLRPPRTLETTLFDRLEKMYGSSIKRMLDVQYR